MRLAHNRTAKIPKTNIFLSVQWFNKICPIFARFSETDIISSSILNTTSIIMMIMINNNKKSERTSSYMSDVLSYECYLK